MTVRARICWASRDEGGREAPPSGPTYSTVARFNHPGGDWTTEAWSLVLEGMPADSSLSAIVDVRFLSPEGPGELLSSGSTFELFEGDRKVATGTVL